MGLPKDSEKWGVDVKEPTITNLDFKFIKGSIFEVDLPTNYFDLIFISNFLEHLNNIEEIQKLLEKLKNLKTKDGYIIIIGPNFKYTYREYFDCADHKIPLTHVTLEEIIYSCDLDLVRVHPKFLPFSFHSRLPVSKLLVKMYLKNSFFWFIFGKQFLIVVK